MRMELVHVQHVIHVLARVGYNWPVTVDLGYRAVTLLNNVIFIACYRIAGNFGERFNLAIWRSIAKPPN